MEGNDISAKQLYIFKNTLIKGTRVNGQVSTLWPWSWTFTVQHTIYVKCEYFMNPEG